MALTRIRSRRRAWAVPLVGLLILSSGLAWALEPKDSPSYLAQKEFFKPELYISSAHEALEEALDKLPNKPDWESFQAARALELVGQRRQGLAEPVVQLAGEPAPLVLLHLPHRLGEAAEAALPLDEPLEEALVLARDVAHAVDDLVHGVRRDLRRLPQGTGRMILNLFVRPSGRLRSAPQAPVPPPIDGRTAAARA